MMEAAISKWPGLGSSCEAKVLV